MTTLPLPDETATMALGARLARLARPGDVLALDGTLGAGKSTLARAFVRALTCPEEEVPSPTFTLVQTYDADHACVWHFDLYRLERPDEVWELGFEEALADGICLIEWPSRLGGLLPRRHLLVRLDIDGAARRATLSGGGDWEQRLKGLADD